MYNSTRNKLYQPASQPGRDVFETESGRVKTNEDAVSTCCHQACRAVTLDAHTDRERHKQTDRQTERDIDIHCIKLVALWRSWRSRSCNSSMSHVWHKCHMFDILSTLTRHCRLHTRQWVLRSGTWPCADQS